VEIDRARSDDAAPRVDLLRPASLEATTHPCDTAVLDADVGLIARHAGAVHHRSATNHKIELGHALFLLELRVADRALSYSGSTSRADRACDSRELSVC